MKNSKYWETEKGEVVKFGNSFMRCYENRRNTYRKKYN